MKAFYRKLIGAAPMTFQVGLVASDGILIASDTRMIETEGVRASSKTSKILSGAKIACAYSGDDVSERAAHEIVKKLSNNGCKDEVQSALEETGRAAWEEAFGSESIPRSRIQARRRVLVAFAQDLQLWLLDIFAQPLTRPIKDKVCIGDSYNPAVFFLERYYPSQPTPIRALDLLAAHTVLTAGVMNPTVVAGLEIVSLKPDGAVDRYDSKVLEELAQRSSELNQQIQSLLHDGKVADGAS